MKMLRLGKACIVGLAIFAATAFNKQASGALTGTVLLLPNSSVVPGTVPAATAPGNLLATLSSPFSFTTTAGTTSGTLVTAVYKESGGTLDFYYQIDNGTSSATSVSRETDTSFTGFTTSVGSRTDGASLTGTTFVNGSAVPQSADRDAGATVGFDFNPPVTAKIAPGQSSLVLVISTNATSFTAGNTSIIDGGSQTVASFQPTVPEPAALAACVLLTSLLIRRRAV
jgi:hypothetical protein